MSNSNNFYWFWVYLSCCIILYKLIEVFLNPYCHINCIQIAFCTTLFIWRQISGFLVQHWGRLMKFHWLFCSGMTLMIITILFGFRNLSGCGSGVGSVRCKGGFGWWSHKLRVNWSTLVEKYLNEEKEKTGNPRKDSARKVPVVSGSFRMGCLAGQAQERVPVMRNACFVSCSVVTGSVW